MTSAAASLMPASGDTRHAARVLRIWQTLRVGPLQRRIEFMRFGAPDLRPLIFLHSLEFANAPTWGFCADAAEAGFGTLAIRRPGFGASDKSGGADEQAGLLAQFLEEAGIDNALLVAIGSACPAGYRLAARSRRIAYSAFVNCVFNRDVVGEFQPAWLGPIFVQTLRSSAGARLSLAVIRQLSRQQGASAFLASVAAKSPGDVAFVRTFQKDIEAGWNVSSSVDVETFRDEMRYSLSDDPLLTDGAFAGLPAIALSGAETTPTWQAGFEAEAARLGIAAGYLPSGDLFAAYQSGGALLKLLTDRAR